MSSMTITEARKRLFQLVDSLGEDHEPILIAGRRNNAVLIGEEDWRAITETLHLTQIPGMVESIKEGMATPPEEMSSELDW